MRSNLLYVVQKTRDITAGAPPRRLYFIYNLGAA